MNFVQLENEKLDVNAINDLVAHESCGAISLFVGTTRDNFENKKVISLEYEAFEPMAVKKMTAICEELRTKWPDIKNIAIYHRLGMVPVKEASVVIAVSSPHRETSLLSVQHAINTLKSTVPIWKKELYEGNEAAWKENKESDTSGFGRKGKRPKLDFSACSIESVPLPKNLVQITADETEVVRRIHCFVEKKREEIDSQNISCFTEKLPTDGKQPEDEETCARVNSTVFKQKDSNGHLRVRRVKNEIGPQIKPDYASTLNKLMGNMSAIPKIKQEPSEQDQYAMPHGLEERIENIEDFLGKNPKPVPRNLFERVKNLEDRLLYLESISPEYYHFIGEKPPLEVIKKRKKPSYTIEDLDKFIDDIKKSIV